jgi:hypothetical protein
MFSFGLVTLLQGFVQNYAGILTTRFFLGAFEAGMFPGCKLAPVQFTAAPADMWDF